jgi:hypothetical protein
MHNTWDAMSDKTKPIRLTDKCNWKHLRAGHKLLENVTSTTVPLMGALSKNPDCKAASFHTHCRWRSCCCLQRHYRAQCQSPQSFVLGWLSDSLAATGVPLVVPWFASLCSRREKKPVYTTRILQLVATPVMALGGLLARWQQAPRICFGFAHLHLHHLPKANELT